jgi:hypothetical protein
VSEEYRVVGRLSGGGIVSKLHPHSLLLEEELLLVLVALLVRPHQSASSQLTILLLSSHSIARSKITEHIFDER